MQKIDARWLRAAFDRTKKTQADLAKRLGLNPAQVNRMLAEVKPRRIKADEIPAILEFFANESLDQREIIENAQPLRYAPLTEWKDWPRDLPVYGVALGGSEGGLSFNGQVIDYLRRPPRLHGVTEAYAIYVNGDSMRPWRKSGEQVYVHPGLPCRPGDYVVIQLKPEQEGDAPIALVKELVRRTEKEVRLKQYNPDKEFTIPAGRVHKMHRVIDWSELLGH